MIILGLTGSIGMGKSTAAQIFRNMQIPVYDADYEVHKLLSSNGKAVHPIAQAFPTTKIKTKDGLSINRQALGTIVFDNQNQRKKLESILHPLVKEKTDSFIKTHREKNSKLVVLDIPLLYETKGELRCDYVLVVTADPEVQKKRVLERPFMTEEKFHAILNSQYPDKEKRKKADFVVWMQGDINQNQQDLQTVIDQILERHTNKDECNY